VTSWTYLEQGRIHLVWAVIAVLALLVVLELQTRGAMSAFLSPVMQRRLTAQAGLERTIVKLALIGISLGCGIGALMRPRAPGESERVPLSHESADVMFVLDVSRSMLAEDAAPNRLAAAKAAIGVLSQVELADDRVGLIAFAGRAALVCPLTPDHAFFETALADVDTRSAGKGGSKVGEAIKAATASFPAGQGAKLVVLITDGDDQDPYTQEAAKKARDAGVKIVAIGFGSEAGAEIQLTDPQSGARAPLMHDGKPVISKLDAEALRKIALVTEGAYVPAGTNAVDLHAIVQSHVKPLMREANEKAYREIPAERFQWYVLGAMVSLLAALWVGAGTRRMT
jgi:Ca-activated chloride channel family protein